MLRGLLRRSSADLLKRYSQIIWASPCLERLIPQSITSVQDLSRYTSLTQFPPDLNAYTEGLCKPAWSMLARRGKSWRGTFCLLTTKAFGGEVQQAIPLAISCELLHNASLIIDDVEDKSEVRRGKPAVHMLFGEELAINAGCYLYFVAQLAVKETTLSAEIQARLSGLYLRELLALHLGQCSDLQWNRIPNFMPTPEQYFQMVVSKTGAMVRLPVHLGAQVANCSVETIEKLMQLSENLGIAFQIRDDVLNLESETYAASRKYLGEDITEGKKTLITVFACETSPKAARLLEILSMKTSNLALVQEALGIIKDSGALGRANQECIRFQTQAESLINAVFPQCEAKDHLKAIVRFLLQRSA